MTESILELRNVEKYFGDFVAVERINLEVKKGEFFTIVGPSGSGKTTMIRMLVGMDKPSRGDILMSGERVNDVPANRRPTCMVFQSLALFPHKTVGENIEFPLKLRGETKNNRKTRAIELLEQLHLSEAYYAKKVSECSGGEKQRVALARALAFDPEILFFDEPLSALDYRLRKTLEKELKDIQRRTGKTFVYITHSLEEAMVMSDRISIMRDGRIVQIETPDEIYNKPANSFVAQFMGEVNQFNVTRQEDARFLDTDTQDSYVGPPGADLESGILIVRPERIQILAEGEAADTEIAGTVQNQYVLGSRVQYEVKVKKRSLLVETMIGDEWNVGESVRLGWNSDQAFLLAR
nr:ABC transporter ATP-binding protein [uncultured Halomonas sp.]